ncbi:SpoIVB peptidase S55 domain-containing protein [Ureibacillus aquaedulcis]|uniref:SpoIVB peptidase S55 domain-containing protein n=1 Tax=Ureibacillus aquaedulcis TaxID=3058421 RepID=A0ABT8GPM6_9BACL|nr:SpoIVB peptidase S55 domain-containing protein [Ureibacillus sp. BA0131]MDN4493352.1 SpoIVB peptidase S55 domain-containing protein [Ureibacillus sp. BA0131]
MKCHLRNLFTFIILMVFILSPNAEAFAKKLIPMGESIGIQLQLPFVYVAHDVLLPNGQWLKKGDVIKGINGSEVSSVDKIKQQLGTKELTLSVKQKAQEQRDISLTSEQANNILPFLKDETDGIGTLTFIDPESKQYGALGHQIIDGVLNEPPDFTDGSIFLASIEQIKKSSPGNPGYKISVIENNNVRLGNVKSNDLYGIFGSWESEIKNNLRKPIEIMKDEEIALGKAEIYTAIEGSEVEAFEVEIVKIEDNFLQFLVTDKELLEKTGGILQGMSGSPVIQNGQFVGAVTHMFVEQPSKGAAITVNEMLKKKPK